MHGMAVGTMVEMANEEPRSAGGRKPLRRLSPDERAFMFVAIARVRLAHPGARAISPLVERIWEAVWGWTPGRDCILDFMSRPQYESERQIAIQAEGRRLAGMASLTPAGRIALCDHIIASAMEPRPVGKHTQRIIRDGNWVDETTIFVKPDLKSAIEAMRLREDILQRVENANAHVEFRPPAGGAKMMEAARKHLRDDEEHPDIDPSLVAELDAEAGQPFRMPDIKGTTLSYEQHREMIRRWEEEGIAPPGAPRRPTRIVHDDGTIEILEGDRGGPLTGPVKKVEDVPDYGQALLASRDVR
jgi:hypothetical protein